MKSKGLQNWERTRALGMARYVLVKGVLSYGLTMFIVMTFIVHRSDLSTRFIALSAVLWLIAGAVFGTFTWLFMERHYRRAVPKIIA